MGTPSVEQVARDALSAILVQSIAERSEYGGMIYMQAGRYAATPPRTQGDVAQVDVGQHADNRGCPPESTPIAYYHTHPTYSVAGFKGLYNEFSQEDKDVATEFKLDAYMGSLDGSFFKYDRALGKVLRLRGRLKNS